jgi:hypothetical protein
MHHHLQNGDLGCEPQNHSPLPPLIPALPFTRSTLAGEIAGVASLAQPPGPNHTLAHTGVPIAVRQYCSGLA